MGTKDLKKHLYAVALLLLFLNYVGGITLFPHTHVIDGKIITHSHPYASGSSGHPGHTHSAMAIAAISNLASGALFTIAVLLSAIFIVTIRLQRTERYGYHYQTGICRTIALRGPPCC